MVLFVADVVSRWLLLALKPYRNKSLRRLLGKIVWLGPGFCLMSVLPYPGGGVGGWVWQNFRVGGCPTTPPPPQGRVGLCGGLGPIEPVPLLSFFCCRFRVTWARIVCALCRMRRG